MARRLQNGTWVSSTLEGSLVMLPDGRRILGLPQGTDEQAATAKRLGYGDDVLQMVRDHDPLHAMLCDLLGLPTSYALSTDPGEAGEREWAEEEAVLAVQKFMRLAGGRLLL
jgi:hypothetical protein